MTAINRTENEAAIRYFCSADDRRGYEPQGRIDAYFPLTPNHAAYGKVCLERVVDGEGVSLSGGMIEVGSADDAERHPGARWVLLDVAGNRTNISWPLNTPADQIVRDADRSSPV